MSLLSVIQSFCKLNALAVPSSVTGSTDTTAIQLWEVLKTVCEEVVTQSNFNVTTQEASFALTATEDQGALATLAPYGYQAAIFETFYDRTLRLALVGPISEAEWQQLKALPTTGTAYKFRIKNDHLLINPIPTVPLSTIAFEYVSNWYTKSGSGVLKATPDNDADTFLFPENILKEGLNFYWKQLKGLPYQAHEKRFYDLLNNYIARDKVKRRINIGDTSQDLRPGIMVPTNTWNVH